MTLEELIQRVAYYVNEEQAMDFWNLSLEVFDDDKEPDDQSIIKWIYQLLKLIRELDDETFDAGYAILTDAFLDENKANALDDKFNELKEKLLS